MLYLIATRSSYTSDLHLHDSLLTAWAGAGEPIWIARDSTPPWTSHPNLLQREELFFQQLSTSLPQDGQASYLKPNWKKWLGEVGGISLSWLEAFLTCKSGRFLVWASHMWKYPLLSIKMIKELHPSLQHLKLIVFFLPALWLKELISVISCNEDILPYLKVFVLCIADHFNDRFFMVIISVPFSSYFNPVSHETFWE